MQSIDVGYVELGAIAFMLLVLYRVMFPRGKRAGRSEVSAWNVGGSLGDVPGRVPERGRKKRRSASKLPKRPKPSKRELRNGLRRRR